MDTETRLISEIVSSPFEDEPRLKYAEFLERERYQLDAAQLLKIQCEWDSTEVGSVEYIEQAVRQCSLQLGLYNGWLDRISGVPEHSLRDVWQDCVAAPDCLSTAEGRRRARRSARNLMRRAGWNIRKIVSRLHQSRYQFVFEPRSHAPVTSQQLARIMDFQASQRWVFPVSFMAFLIEIGTVNLMGRHPDWLGTGYYFEDTSKEIPQWLPDPLVVDTVTLVELLPSEHGASEESLRLEIGPDYWHKSGVSGCGAQALTFGNGVVEATICEYESLDRQFVPFLQNVFDWGGFPGFKFEDHAPQAFLNDLRKGLVTL